MIKKPKNRSFRADSVCIRCRAKVSGLSALTYSHSRRPAQLANHSTNSEPPTPRPRPPPPLARLRRPCQRRSIRWRTNRRQCRCQRYRRRSTSMVDAGATRAMSGLCPALGIEFCPCRPYCCGVLCAGFISRALQAALPLRRIVRKPELTRPTIPHSANLAVSRSYRTNSKASEQEQTVLVQTEHEYESSTEDRMYRI